MHNRVPPLYTNSIMLIKVVFGYDKTFPFQMMNRRDDLTFRQEMKFRNKLVEYLTDWIMGNPHQLNVQGDVSMVSR